MTMQYLDADGKVRGISADTNRKIDRKKIMEHFVNDPESMYVRIKGYVYTGSDIYAGRKGTKTH